MEDLREDDTYVQYDEDRELVFHQVSLKVSDMLGEAKSITSDSDWTEQPSPQKTKKPKRVQQDRDSRNSSCPVTEFDFRGRKLKFHVQTENLPRILWDDPLPPIREDRVGMWTEWRYQILLFLAKCLVPSGKIQDLLEWCTEVLTPRISLQCQILERSQDQMKALSKWMYWPNPEKFQLVPPNSMSALIHWRYQVLLYEHLDANHRLQYLNFGHAFISDIYII